MVCIVKRMCFFARKKGRVPREVPFPKSDKRKIRSISFVSWHGDQFANNYSFLKVSNSFKSGRKAKLAFNDKMKKLIVRIIPSSSAYKADHAASSIIWLYSIECLAGGGEGGGISLLSINHHLSTRGHHHHQSPSPLPASGSSFFR